MEESEFANLYVERMLGELTDLMKYKIMADTKIQVIEKMNARLTQERDGLHQEYLGAVAKIEELQGKLDKRQSKAPASKAVDTF